MKKITAIVICRVSAAILFLLHQIVFFVTAPFWPESSTVYGVFITAAVVTAVFIVNGKSKPEYKIGWLLVTLVLPVFGVPFYIFFGRERIGKRLVRKMNPVREMMREIGSDNGVLEALGNENPLAAIQAKYINDSVGCPPFRNTATEYLRTGEATFERLKRELEQAHRYIFFEFFIIQEGVMWNSILDILVRKVSEGVDVRIIYDDFGCMSTLKRGYDKKLRSMGIKCQVYNPPSLLTGMRFANRNHRKIAVIDGYTAFSGGINLSDEYVNIYKKYGYWKDSDIMLKGEAAWSFTVMFLSMWNSFQDTDKNYTTFRPGQLAPTENCAGYVQPFADSPLDTEPASENILLNLVGRAEKYIYINTPYLIIGSEMIAALSLAAKSGVDVRIMTPHIPDKWYVQAVTRSNYDALLESGVKIYEFTPGFMHTKAVVSDDRYAVTGSVNFDYRSFYLNLECGVWMYMTESVRTIHDDFLYELKRCTQITAGTQENIPFLKKFGHMLLKFLAPVM